MLGELLSQPFSGFPEEGLKFLKLLSVPKNNSKIWFDKHRDEYEKFLKLPMRELIDTLSGEIRKIDPDIVVNYKSIFRINRDIRFSKNKMPYKSLYSAAFAFDRIKTSEIPQFYFHFNKDEFLFAAGQYSTDINNLRKIRKTVFENFRYYKSLVNERKFKNYYGNVSGESLIKIPKEFENLTDENTDPLLQKSMKMKQFYVYRSYSPEIVLTEEIKDIILDNIRASHRFTKFLSNSIK